MMMGLRRRLIGILKRDPQNKNPTIMLRFGHGYHYKGSLAEVVRCLDLNEDAYHLLNERQAATFTVRRMNINVAQHSQ